jgi:glycosyltransferase involved in cell wall biosynthesis
MITPKVSILIPAYNQPQYLRDALTSIKYQTFKDFEVIITDDSSDNSMESIVDEYPELDIKYYKNPVRLGSPRNWNEAIAKSSGEYIKFLHHDDWFTNTDGLQLFVQALDDNPQSDFAFSCSNACNPSGSIIRTHCPEEYQLTMLKDDPTSVFQENFIGAPSATIYRRTVNKLFDTRMKWRVDIDFYISVLKQNPEFVFIPKDLVCCMCGLQAVTQECQNSIRIRLFEWVYLYLKIILGRI